MVSLHFMIYLIPYTWCDDQPYRVSLNFIQSSLDQTNTDNNNRMIEQWNLMELISLEKQHTRTSYTFIPIPVISFTPDLIQQNCQCYILL